MEEIRALPRPRPARKRTRTANPDAQRRLIEAAREVVNERGMTGLRVEDVARRAGLSVGTFYLYFEGKDDLFAKLVVEYTGRLRERMQAAYAKTPAKTTASTTDLANRFERGLIAYLDFVEENEKGFLHFRDAGAIETNAGRLSTWAMHQHAEDLKPLLVEGIEAGIFRDEDPDLLAQSMLGLIQHVAGWWIEHREHCSREQLQRFALELTGRGMLS
jgi:AcrR family transcriptional regulator